MIKELAFPPLVLAMHAHMRAHTHTVIRFEIVDK